MPVGHRLARNKVRAVCAFCHRSVLDPATARRMTPDGGLLNLRPQVRPFPGYGKARHETDECLNIAEEKCHLPSKRILFLRLHHNYLAFCVDVFSELPGDRNQGDHRLLTVGSEAFILLLGDPRP